MPVWHQVSRLFIGWGLSAKIGYRSDRLYFVCGTGLLVTMITTVRNRFNQTVTCAAEPIPIDADVDQSPLGDDFDRHLAVATKILKKTKGRPVAGVPGDRAMQVNRSVPVGLAAVDFRADRSVRADAPTGVGAIASTYSRKAVVRATLLVARLKEANAKAVL